MNCRPPNKPAAANPGWRIQIYREPGWRSDVISSGVAEPERSVEGRQLPHIVLAVVSACLLCAGSAAQAERSLRPCIKRSGTNLVFNWPSKTGMVYHLLIDDDSFGIASPDIWPIYRGNSGIAATPPTNSLVVPYQSGDTEGFFVVRELQEPTNGMIKVFLLGGQSNMSGSGTAVSDLPPELQGAQSDILFFHGSSSALEHLQPGSGSSYGPEITFGRAVADTFTNDTFALIKYARGATDLENDWNPATGSTYTVFRNVVSNGLNALVQAGYAVEIVGMLWTQGERDARLGFEAAYETNLHEFVADVRSRYGVGLPFFVSQLSSQQTSLPASGLAKVRQAQASIAAVDPDTYLIVTDTFDMGDDNLHFSSAGQMALGQGFADAYEALPKDTYGRTLAEQRDAVDQLQRAVSRPASAGN